MSYFLKIFLGVSALSYESFSQFSGLKIASFQKSFDLESKFQTAYRNRVNNGRGLYSKIIFWPLAAACNQERLQFKKYFLNMA